MIKFYYSLSIAFTISILCLAGCVKEKGYPDGNSRYEAFAPDGIPFKVADTQWKVDQRGHHRAVVTVGETSADGVVAQLPWRRPDLRIDTKRIIVTDAEDNEIKDVMVTEMTSEKGEVVFRPTAGAGTYYIYYLPYKWRPGSGDARYGKPWNDYLPPEYDTDKAWAEKVAGGNNELPKATVKCFESVSRFNFWSPMGLIATKEEMDAVKSAAGKDMVIFPEDRAFPIQLTCQIPARWAKGPKTVFKEVDSQLESYWNRSRKGEDHRT